jgi:hypothetical protein
MFESVSRVAVSPHLSIYCSSVTLVCFQLSAFGRRRNSGLRRGKAASGIDFWLCHGVLCGTRALKETKYLGQIVGSGSETRKAELRRRSGVPWEHGDPQRARYPKVVVWWARYL